MAIYGAGSKWDEDEMKVDFIANNNFVIGWDYNHAKDLYDIVSSLKAGDIIYLKANQVGSRNLRVKAIGIVTQSFVHTLIENSLTRELITNWNSFTINVRWIVRNEFQIQIPESEGKLTNVRAATFYEENLPLVQSRIIENLINQIS
ncbi:MAG: hypothetical protein RL264_2403 [Bacteroidota bacterium]|jgi:hypothetical protein